MTSNKYKYAIIDQSLIIQRNLFAISRGKRAGEYTVGELIKSCIYTLNKIPRDYGITADKYIFFMDKWDGDKGYITTQLLDGAYKDSRGDIEGAKGTGKPGDAYMTEERLEELKNNPESTQEMIRRAEDQLYSNQVKLEAKYKLADELKNFGVPSFGVPGWEFDQLAYLSNLTLFNIQSKPNVIITQDSDLTYSISPMCDYFRIPRSNQDPKIITYDEMQKTIPDNLKDKISLYTYGAYLNALGISHNGMRKTKKNYVSPEKVIENILGGDYSDVNDEELFTKQLSTYDIQKYPRLSEATDIIVNLLPKYGKLGTYEEWARFCDKYKISGLSISFFNKFISRFDSSLFGKL